MHWNPVTTQSLPFFKINLIDYLPLWTNYFEKLIIEPSPVRLWNFFLNKSKTILQFNFHIFWWKCSEVWRFRFLFKYYKTSSSQKLDHFFSLTSERVHSSFCSRTRSTSSSICELLDLQAQSQSSASENFSLLSLIFHSHIDYSLNSKKVPFSTQT